MSSISFFRRHWVWLFGVLVAALVLLGATAFIWSRSNAGPPKPDPIPIGDYTYTLALAEHHIDKIMSQYHIPGMAAALVLDQEVIWQDTFGLADIEEEQPVTEDTVFKTWSLAKAFTATEFMRLVEEGLVDLDAPIDDYIPGYTIQSRFPAEEPITFRQLLAHRSGLPRNNCEYVTEWHMGSDALERLAAAVENCFLVQPSGSRFKYSNIGYITLGYVIQQQRGESFPARMDQHLLAPIGMTSSSFWSGALPAGAELATGYDYFEGEQYPLEQRDHINLPSGNLFATVGDLSNFLRFLFRDGEAGGEQLISPDTLAAMYEDQYSRPADPQTMGLGWKIARVFDSEKMIWHDGGPTEGVGALVAFLPEQKMGVVLLGNATSFEGSIAAPLAQELLEAMLETELGVTAAEEPPHESVAVDAAILNRYTGSYAAFGDTLDVTLSGDQLKGSIQGMSFDLVPVADDRFRLSHWLLTLGLADLLKLPMDLADLEMTFRVDGESGQDHMIVNLGGFSYEFFPRIPGPSERKPEWAELVGHYDLIGRLASGAAGDEKLGEGEITLTDGLPTMKGAIGPLLPISQDAILILSGPFAGETITRDFQTGYLYHQGFVYQPK